MTTTTTRSRSPVVFLAVATLVASLLAILQPPVAEATHQYLAATDATGFECNPDDGNNTVAVPIRVIDPAARVVGAEVPEPAHNDITVEFSTFQAGAGQATKNVDYVHTTGTVTISSGSSEGTATVELDCDGVGDDDEDFFVIFHDPEGASFFSKDDQKATVTIKDGKPEMGFSASNESATEGSPTSTPNSVVFELSFVGSEGDCPCSVDFATEDGTATAEDDYHATSGTRVFSGRDNEPLPTVTVFLKHDNDPEANEHFFLRLSNPNAVNNAAAENVRSDGKAEIFDDDAPSISVLESVRSESESPLRVAFESTAPLAADVYIVWRTEDGSATDGSDYVGTGGRVATLMAEGEDTAGRDVALKDDAELEDWHENFGAFIDCLQTDSDTECQDGKKPEPAVATQGTAFGLQDVQDDEPKISVSDASATEGESMAFTVTLAEFREESEFPSSGDEISVDFKTADTKDHGSATEGEDYNEKSGTLTWTDEDREAGNRTKQVIIDTKQDGASEGNETFNLVLSNAQFAGIGDGSGQGLIIDDDAFNVDAGPTRSGESATEVSFTGSASCPDSCTYTWDFGDGGTANGVTVKHRYDETGTYTVTFSVESSSGSTAADTTTATITDSGKVDRDSGTDREKTAVAVSSKNWAQADTVLLATGYAFPDALAAGPLAKKLDAPLLLTNPNGLPDEVKNELERLDAERVVILGGAHAVPQSQADELAADGYTIQRIAGINRFGTAADIATGVGPTSANEVTVSLGDHADPNRDAWPDALSAGSFASLSEPLPALLTHNQFVPQETLDALEDLDTEKIFLLGGPVAISAAVEAQLESEGYTVQRVFGDDRYETSVEAAEIAMSRYPAGQVHPVFATGLKFPDGLSGGALAGKVGGPVVLVPKDDLNATPSVRTFLRDEANRFDVGTVVGGPMVISDNVKDQARSDIDTT